MKALLAALCLGLPLAAQAAETAAPAADNAPRVWRALSGDRLELDGATYRLGGVTCPAPETGAGRAAKALLNTFLRNGYVVCRAADGQAVCQKDGRDFAEGLIASGHCSAAPAADLPADAARLVRDTRPGGLTRNGLSGPARRVCDPSRQFVARSQAFACDAGVPFSLCQGTTGLRQFGRPVAPSDRFRATGETAPAFNPFECR